MPIANPFSDIEGRISGGEVANVASQAGWRGEELVDAVAVAWEESSFGSREISPTGCCYGLWQIHLKAHGKSAEDMYDPLKNALAANTIFRDAGNTFAKDWSVWPVSKASRKIAEKAIASHPNSKEARGRTPATGELGRFGEVPGDIAEGIVGDIDWGQILLVAGGAVAILFGVVFLATQVL